MTDESGFTLMETLCALAVILACVGAAGSLAHGARRITGGIQERSSLYLNQLRIEKLIRETIEGITVSYWEQDERGLQIARESVHNVLMETADYSIVDFKPIKDSLGRIRGVSYRYHIGGREYEGLGLFASVPLPLVREKW